MNLKKLLKSPDVSVEQLRALAADLGWQVREDEEGVTVPVTTCCRSSAVPWCARCSTRRCARSGSRRGSLHERARRDATASTGFADANARFFRMLAKNQNRDWFLAHKDEYERGWLAPMKALLTELRYRLERGYPCELGEPKVFRIFRDVRFSKDKSPYKTQVAGYVPLAGMGGRVPGPVAVYLHLGIDDLRRRRPLDHGEAAARALPQGAARRPPRRRAREAAAKLEKAGFAAGSHDALKKVPRGIDPAHPRAELLKRKGLVVAYPAFDRKLVVSRALVDWLVKQSRRAAPVVEWLVRMGEAGATDALRPSSARR